MCLLIAMILVVLEAAGSVPYIAGEVAGRLVGGAVLILISLVVPNLYCLASSIVPLADHAVGGLGCALAAALEVGL